MRKAIAEDTGLAKKLQERVAFVRMTKGMIAMFNDEGDEDDFVSGSSIYTDNARDDQATRDIVQLNDDDCGHGQEGHGDERSEEEDTDDYSEIGVPLRRGASCSC